MTHRTSPGRLYSFENFFTSEARTSGRRVLITGGSSGIGKSLVETFALCGDEVYFTYNTGNERAEQIRTELSACNVTSIHFEQSSTKSIKRLVRQVPMPVDIIILNAAYGSKTIESASNNPQKQDQIMMQVNATGPLLLTESFLPSMIKHGSGTIVFISSVGGGITQFPGFRYSDAMSKASLAYLTRHLGAELSNVPIDVFAVCPGATDTPMLHKSTLDGLSPSQLADFTKRLPDHRLIKPEEIAQLVYLLCSTNAGHLLRGSVIDASLGLGVNPGLLTH